MENKKITKWTVIGIYILSGIVCFAISIPMFSQNLVLDEAYSVVVARRSPTGIVMSAAKDVHPPLYYFVLWIVRVLFGESIVKYHFITALASYLNIFWLGATMIRKKWGNRVAMFYILWFGLTYCTMERTMILRMYPLGCLLVTAVVIYLISLYDNWKKSDFCISIILTIAAMYTHYFAVMAVFAAWLVIFGAVCFKKRDRIKTVIGAGIMIGLGYAPWMGVVLSQAKKVSENYWISYFDWKGWFEAPASLMEASLTGCGYALYFLALVLFLTACVRRNRDAIVSALVFAGTMIIGAMLSVLVAPIWVDRYLYVSWGAFSLMAALTLGESVGDFSFITQGAAALLLCAVGVISVITIYESDMHNNTSKEWVSFLEENIEPEDYVIMDDAKEHWLMYQAYLPDNQILKIHDLVKMDSSELEGLIANTESRNVWYVINYIMQAKGVDRMEEMCGQFGLRMRSEGSYIIKDKELEIFSIK